MKNQILKKALEEQALPKKIMNFKVTKEQMEAIKDNARKYFNGNISGWMRYTALNYVPQKKELTTKENHDNTRKVITAREG
jgi:hypothetical protein